MKLIEDLRGALATEPSMFRAQLMREDVARLEKVVAFARQYKTFADFEKQAMYVGWTRDDMRTHDVKEPLTTLLEAIWKVVKFDPAASEADVEQAWVEFCKLRLKVLVHCL